jgi:1,2-phenylacetyl-CoA epoxidase catalytic subunit
MREATTVVAADLPEGARHRLEGAIRSLADSKRLMGIRYSDWLLGAPSIEAGIAASSMSQDEWGHARLLYAMLKDFGADPEAVEHDRPAADYGCVDALDRPFENWAEVVAGMVVVDGAISAALEGFAAGTFEPARSRVPKMLAEEEFHADLGAAWFRRLADAAEEAHTALADACRRFLPRTLAWLSPEDHAGVDLADRGIFDSGPDARARFESAVGDLLSLVGIDLTSIEADRSGWDPERGRGPGEPDEESVVRARGDRNRALLVE